jgi:hypothetical protein
VQNWATASFKSAFKALPTHTSISFETFDVHCIKNAQNPAICVGSCRSEADSVNQKVFGVVHGRYDNVALMVKDADVGSSELNLLRGGLSKVELDYPFAHAFHPSSLTFAKQTTLGALVCYYLLAAGHVSELAPVKDFTRDFKWACKSLAARRREQSEKDSQEDLSTILVDRDTDEQISADHTEETPALSKSRHASGPDEQPQASHKRPFSQQAPESKGNPGRMYYALSANLHLNPNSY